MNNAFVGLGRDATLTGDVWVLLDESGTSRSDERLFVGAVVTTDIDALESEVFGVHQFVLGDDACWVDKPERRSHFATKGFHFVEDSETIRDRVREWLSTAGLRAYFAHSRNHAASELNVEQRMMLMYESLLRSLALRYRGMRIHLIFEEHQSMDRRYEAIWKQALEEAGVATEGHSVERGTKQFLPLVAVDYFLGFAREAMQTDALPFKVARFKSLAGSISYSIDFDEDKHFNNRRRAIV